MKIRLLPVIFLATLLCAGSLQAQNIIILRDSTEVPELTIDEIEVKSSKNNLTLKQLPASVTLVSSKTIEKNEVYTLNDLTSLSPGYFMPDYGSKLTSPIYIRGIGSRINSPSVGLYVDNVPFFEKASYSFNFFDVERVEILKGPQGTLYGRNTMGGIINVVTRSPLTYQGNSLGLTAGTYGRYGVNFSHYNKAGEKFAYSLSMNYLHNDGYYTNTFNNNQVDRANSIGARNRIIWSPGERLSIENILFIENNIEGGYPYAMLNDSTKEVLPINYNQASSYNRTMISDALIIRLLFDNMEFQASSAYQYLDDLQSIDQDFTADSLYFVSQVQSQHMLSQELVLRSKGKSPLKWIIGGYGFMQLFDKEVTVDVYTRNMVQLKNYNSSIAGAALFGQATYDLWLPGLSATAGLRLDYEKDILNYIYDLEAGGSSSNLADTLYPALSYSKLLPKLALNYRFDNTNFFLTAARGYKTGGFNSTFYRDEDLYFLPEDSWNYEAGVRTALFNRSIYLDASLYAINWNNQQIRQQAVYADLTPAPGNRLTNAGRSLSKGFEISLKSVSFMGFSPAVSYGLTDAKFLEYEYVVGDASSDLAGNRLAYVPKHTVSAQLSKSIYLDHSRILDKINIHLLYKGFGSIYWNEENTYSSPYYHILDSQLSIKRGNTTLSIWAKNMLNSDYVSFYFQALGNEYVQLSKPFRTGINLKVNF